jgi:hypothetical protein
MSNAESQQNSGVTSDSTVTNDVTTGCDVPISYAKVAGGGEISMQTETENKVESSTTKVVPKTKSKAAQAPREPSSQTDTNVKSSTAKVAPKTKSKKQQAPGGWTTVSKKVPKKKKAPEAQESQKEPEKRSQESPKGSS